MDAAGEFTEASRIRLGTLDLVPKLDRAGCVKSGHWVLPGRQVLTTDQVRQLARKRGLYFEVIH